MRFTLTPLLTVGILNVAVVSPAPNPSPVKREGLKCGFFPFPSLRGEGAGDRGTTNLPRTRLIPNRRWLLLVLIAVLIAACQPNTAPPPDSVAEYGQSV